MIKALFSLLALTTFSLYANTLQLQWKVANLDFDSTINNIFQNKNCNISAQYFVGCIAAANQAFRFANPGQQILVEYNLSSLRRNEFNIKFLNHLDHEEFNEVKKKYFEYLKINAPNILKDYSNILLFDKTEILKVLKAPIVNNDNRSYIAAQIMNAFLAVAIDPHTYLVPKVRLKEFEQESIPQIGLGIQFVKTKLGTKHVLVISDIIPNSPAEKIGLEKGNIIYAINGKTGARIVEGLKDNQLNILLRNNENKIKKISVTKTNYETPVVSSKLVNGLGYLKIANFTADNLCKNVLDHGEKLLLMGAQGLVIDLRDNLGGKVEEAKCIMSLFLDGHSRIWGERKLESNTINYHIKSISNGQFSDISTVVLINENSASASEAMAMYLQGYEKAIIVGERSFGKGSMQSITPSRFNNKVAMGKTIALYYGPQGVSPQLRGVEPEIPASMNIENNEPIKFNREAERYLYPILDPSLVLPITANRVSEISEVRKCVASKNLINTYKKLPSHLRAVYDNQLEVGFATLGCAIDYINMTSYRGIKINSYFRQKEQPDSKN